MRFKTILVAQAISAALVTSASLGSFAFLASRFENQAASAMSSSKTVAEILIENQLAQVEFQRQVQAWKNILVRGKDKVLFDKNLKEFNDKEKIADEKLARVGQLAKSANLSIDPIDPIVSEHKSLGEKYRKALQSWDAEEAFPGAKVDLAVRGMDRKTSEAIQSLAASIEKASAARFDEQSSSAKSLALYSFWTIAASVALSLFTFIFGAFYSTRAILRILGGEPEQLQRSLGDIASGNLTKDIDASTPDSLSASASSTQSLLRKLIGDIVGSSRDVATFSYTVSTQGDELTRATHVQSQRCSELAVVLEELSTSISTLSSASARTNEVAASFKHNTQSSAQGVGEALASLKLVAVEVDDADKRLLALGQAVDKITGLAGAIEALSKQTNLLSLNAAIEAARAGDAGRGFAVVADSVKQLAEKTSSTSQQISQITHELSAAAETARNGMAKARSVCMDSATIEQSSSKLIHMGEQIGLISDSISMIDSSLSEQRDALAMANRSVSDLSRESASTADTANVLSQASASMKEAANKMSSSTDKFKV